MLCAAPEFATAFVETVVRDRFTRHQGCEVAAREITARVRTRISMPPASALTSVDLRGDDCTRVGAPTDTVNARNHAAGRAFAKTIHAEHVDVDGIVYASRLTGGDVHAVFDRSTEKLASVDTGLSKDHSELPNILKRYGIGLVSQERLALRRSLPGYSATGGWSGPSGCAPGRQFRRMVPGFIKL